MNKLNVLENTGELDYHLKTIEGQLIMFGHLINQMETQPGISAKYVEFGIIQKQLSAIHSLINTHIADLNEACRDDAYEW